MALQEAISVSAEETLAIFARKLKELAAQQFDLTLLSDLTQQNGRHVIKFDTDYLIKKGESYEADELETKIVGLLNETRIGLHNIRQVYELLEDALFEQGVANIEEENLLILTLNQKMSLSNLLKSISSEDQFRVARVARGMILRLLVGATSEKIWTAELGMSMQYSDVLHEDEELNERFLDALSADNSLMMSHLLELLRLVTEVRTSN